MSTWYVPSGVVTRNVPVIDPVFWVDTHADAAQSAGPLAVEEAAVMVRLPVIVIVPAVIAG